MQLTFCYACLRPCLTLQGDVRAKTMVKMPVTARALQQRINRKLAARSRQLRAAVGRERDHLGDWFVVDTKANAVREHDVDVAALARRLGVVREWEEMR